MEQLSEAQYLNFNEESAGIHYKIIQQLPIYIRDSLATVDITSVEKIVDALANLELNRKAKNKEQQRSERFHRAVGVRGMTYTGNKYFQDKRSNRQTGYRNHGCYYTRDHLGQSEFASRQVKQCNQGRINP